MPIQTISLKSPNQLSSEMGRNSLTLLPVEGMIDRMNAFMTD